jgi:NADH dehydrogenase
VNSQQICKFHLHFDQPDFLIAHLRGVATLVNTYWVRFDYSLFNHSQAVANTKILFKAAKLADVRRIVHISITNPDIHSTLPYFRGKAELEENLISLGVSYCILRPTIIFGKEDVLINNIAWTLRCLPVFGVFGSGDYRPQPIYVGDLAKLVAEQAQVEGNEILNAIGPETFTYRELVEMIKQTLGLRRLIIGVPAAVGYWIGRLLGWFMRDIIVTRQEIRGLMENRLYVDAPPLGATRRASEFILPFDTVIHAVGNSPNRRNCRFEIPSNSVAFWARTFPAS